MSLAARRPRKTVIADTDPGGIGRTRAPGPQARFLAGAKGVAATTRYHGHEGLLCLDRGARTPREYIAWYFCVCETSTWVRAGSDRRLPGLSTSATFPVPSVRPSVCLRRLQVMGIFGGVLMQRTMCVERGESRTWRQGRYDPYSAPRPLALPCQSCVTANFLVTIGPIESSMQAACASVACPWQSSDHWCTA